MSIDGDWVALTPWARNARGQRAHENVVLVGRDDQALDRAVPCAWRNSRPARRRNCRSERRRIPAARARRARRRRRNNRRSARDARPVDGIDARQPHLVAKSEVPEQLLDDALAIVERALDRERVDVRPIDRRHLPALHVRHPALRIEDEHFDLGLLGESLDRGSAGVARCRSDDRRPGAALTQNAVHRLSQPLHGEILERQRRPWKSSSANRLSSIWVSGASPRDETGIGGLGQRS